MKRSPLRRRSRLNPISKRRSATLTTRAEVRDAVWRRDRGRCQAWPYPEVPCGGPIDVHELVPRSAWPGGELVVDNCICLCREAHRWTHENPQRARTLGLLKSSWERPV